MNLAMKTGVGKKKKFLKPLVTIKNLEKMNIAEIERFKEI
jgi:hypothetical protein